MELVCPLPNGYTLFRESNEVGGHRYWSDEIGGGIIIWDTCLVDKSTLLAAIVEEYRLEVEVFYNKEAKERTRIEANEMERNQTKPNRTKPNLINNT